MKVMITGAKGMVGKNLVVRLVMQPSITLLTPSRTELNLLDQKAVLLYIQNHCPDLVIHLAAKVGGIQANINEPVEFLAENTIINTNVIMGAMEVGVPQLLNMGSSCMYPRGRDILKETDILTGELEPTNEGYALSKVMAARLCQYITRTKSLRYKTIIPCNIYGPYDSFDPVRSHMVPAVIHKLHQAKIEHAPEVTIWGDGESRREFMYVNDLVDFIVWGIPQIEHLPDVINVGLGVDYTINEYYQIGAEVIGYTGTFKHDLTKPAGMQRKLMDVSVAEKLGWTAKTSLRDGIQKTYEYYLNEVICD